MSIHTSASVSKKTPLQIVRLVLGFCCGVPLGFLVICPAASIPLFMLWFFSAMLGQWALQGVPWPALIVVNLVGFMLPRIIRWCRTLHPITTLKRQMSYGEAGGVVSGLVLGTIVGLLMILRGLLLEG